MVLQSTVSTARKNSNSLRATIPEGIVSFLGLKNGDRIEWIMDTKGNKRLVIVVRGKLK